MAVTSNAEFAFRLASQGSEGLGNDRVLFRDGSLECQRSVFDHIETGASLAIVGITPGAVQQRNAENAICAALKAGKSYPEAAREAKFAGSFSGPLRSNLIAMLNHRGAPAAFGIESAAGFFDPSCHGLVHFTSALRHPVFVDGRNYNGSPHLLNTPALRRMVETYLAEEVRALPRAAFLPLGPKPALALQHLVSLGVLDAIRILPPLPHPGGANAERIAFFLERKPRSALSVKTRPELIEHARVALGRYFAQLAAERVPA